jgi:hypothetical protein
MYSLTLIVSLLIISKRQKQPKGPSTDEKKNAYIYKGILLNPEKIRSCHFLHIQEPGRHYAKLSKLVTEGKNTQHFPLICKI